MTQLSDEGEIRRRMMQAIEQARLGIGTTSPNPPVGAVIYQGMKLIGEGYHERAGEAHAEIRAIQDAKKRGNGHLLRGSELYVTLEPCSSYGKTPPCTEAIISEGIGRVYYGVKDPDGRHQGRADAILRAAGIEVAGGVEEEACKVLLRPWMYAVKRKRPWVVVKIATTLDGRIVRRGGEKKISGEEARRYVHQLRAESDAILVGGRTAREDDPQLTVRTPLNEVSPVKKQPLRIVLTRHRNSLPKTLNLLSDREADRTVVIENVEDLGEMLEELYKQYGIVQLMLECGGHLLRKFLEGGYVNEWVQIFSPFLSGGDEYVLPGNYLESEQRLVGVESERYGNDIVLRGLIKSSDLGE